MIDLSKKIINLIEQSRLRVAGYANFSMVVTYFEIGRTLVEVLQEGESRADYGSQLLKQVSTELITKIGKGFSVQNLERMRSFYLVYSKSSNELRNSEIFQKSSNELRVFENEKNSVKILPLSWSHYLFLLRITNELERQFYEIESFTNKWKLKELERQFNTGLFERLSISKDKKSIIELAKKGQIIETAEDIFKEPLILEFLGLEENTSYSETDLETAIINEIEKFMLEMGKGFFFGGRQVRFTFDEDHYRVDLVFYNRLLQCFVLIDLKIGKLSHQDIGQMQMYVNYYDRFVKADTENKTIGIILCKDKNKSLVEITLPENNTQIFASKYQTILPSKITLQRILDNHNQ
jgi:predicted nuclease of restriction endonuclease-like (RecB) superfamily